MSIRTLIVISSLWLIAVLQGFPLTLPALVVIVAAIEQQKYCSGQPNGTVDQQPPDAITLRLNLRLAYRNMSQRSLILPIGEVTALIIRTQGPAAKRENQFAIRLKPRQEPTTEFPADISADSPFNPWFKVIRPMGELDKYFGEYVVLRVHSPSLANPRSELLGRKIYLQLEISHSGLSQTLANRLARRWEPFGNLWTGKTISEPIEIAIPISPKISDCLHEYNMD